MRHVREAVRFSDAVAALRESGVRTFVEIGPDGVLSGMGPQTLMDAGEETVAAEVWLPLLRRGRDEPRALLTALAKVFVRGVTVGWDRVFAGTGARRVDLPTYAFERQRYWLTATTVGRAEDLGLGTPGHPLLGAAVVLPASGGLVLTGRLSSAGQGWLADHVVAGRVVVPGAVLAEMVVRAGDEAGCGRVEELLIETPLVLPERGGVRVQVTVDEPDESGRRVVGVYAQAEDAVVVGDWTRHAAGALVPADSAVDARADVGLVQWPPAGAVAVDLTGFYPALAEAGLAYGPVFQGIRAAWRRGEELFAEVALPEGVGVAGFGVHPALLDAALHVMGLGVERAGLLLPFAWTDVVVHASGAVAARVRVAPSRSGEGVSVTLADGTGELIATVGSLVLRSVSAEAVTAGSDSAPDGLFGVEWVSAAPAEGVAVGVGSGGECGGWVVVGEVGGLDLPGVVSFA
ncbi:polyketide synthase dehydratase domain-containing protein, partial [Streptomyces sp. NPDC007971]|uniref:polyketide synthase dehydratase domain-containing protein n=1 Tax=Streptomyces sp. NPDC007971 TaxID=3364799 RepID=UPI0036E4D089